MLSTRDPPQNKGHIQTESERLEKIFHTNIEQKKKDLQNQLQTIRKWQQQYICK